MLEMNALLGNITKGANAQVAWQSNSPERNEHWKRLIHTQYNDFLKVLNSCGRVREMIKQHHSAQEMKTQAMK